MSKRHGQKEVLKDISLSYFYGAKIGVLGLNGAGKSSLLKILAGVDEAFDGKTVLAPGYTIGYLEQEPLAGETRTVREVVEEGVSELMAIAREFEEINARFAEPMEPEEMDALIERQAQVQELMDHKGVWDRMPGWKWPWTPCAARRPTCPWTKSPAASAAAWPVPPAAAGPGHPAAGRTHQPSGCRVRGLAGALPLHLPRHGHRRDP